MNNGAVDQSKHSDDLLIVEKDVPIPMRDGTILYADKKGHRIRVDMQPRDGVGSAPYTHYHADYNAGVQNTVYAGGDKPSYLLLPVIPAKSA